jgi:hypothetical protein
MSVTGISSNYLINSANQGLQNGTKQTQQAFRQLGQDIESGKLAAAQSDLATLEQLMPQYTSTTSALSNSSMSNSFNQLSQDLQAGNLAAAQHDYSTLQLNLQNQPAQPLSYRFGGASTNETTGIGYLTPQQTETLIQQEMQRLYPIPGFGYVTPQQTCTLIQQLAQQFHAGAQAYMDQNSAQTGASSLSVLG